MHCFGTLSLLAVAVGNTNHQPIKLFDTAGFMGSGGVCGGRLFAVSDYAVGYGRAAWLVGSDNLIGGASPATITCGAANQRRPFKPCQTYLAVSAGSNAGVNAGISIPGFHGKYALDAPELVFANISSNDADDVAHWSANIPNNQALAGLRLSIQGLSLPAGELPSFSNTATLALK